MATLSADLNEFNTVFMVEGAAPSAPGSGLIVAYAKPGGVFAWKDDGGTEHLVGEGDVSAHLADTSDAHDASAVSVLDTAANFTGTDVEAVLAELQDNIDGVSGGGISSGTSFPGSPSTGDLFHRTDRTPALWRYDGTRWLSVQRFIAHPHVKDSTVFTGDSASTSPISRWALPFNGTTYTIYLLSIEIVTIVLTTNNGTNNWTFAAVTVPSSTGVGSGITTAADTNTVHTYHSMTVNAVLTSTDEYLSIASTKVLSPGNLIVDGINIHYQLVTT